MPCPTCHRPTSPAITTRYGGVCQRCHNRRRFVAQPVGYGCDCLAGAVQHGMPHESDCRSLRTYRVPGYVAGVRSEAEYLSDLAAADYIESLPY